MDLPCRQILSFSRMNDEQIDTIAVVPSQSPRVTRPARLPACPASDLASRHPAVAQWLPARGQYQDPGVGPVLSASSRVPLSLPPLPLVCMCSAIRVRTDLSSAVSRRSETGGENLTYLWDLSPYLPRHSIHGPGRRKPIMLINHLSKSMGVCTWHGKA